MEETAEKRPRKRPLPGSHLMDKLDTLLSPRRPPPESVTLRRSAVGVIGSRDSTSAEKDGMASSAVCRCRPIIQPTNSKGENSE